MNIRVFGVNALTQDKEVTDKYTVIYERIQAIQAYTCKKIQVVVYVHNTYTACHILSIRTPTNIYVRIRNIRSIHTRPVIYVGYVHLRTSTYVYVIYGLYIPDLSYTYNPKATEPTP